MIVVDTNVVVYLFIRGERTALARELLRLDNHWVLPPLWRSEFRNAVIQSARQRVISFDDARHIAERAEAMFGSQEIEVDAQPVIDLAAASTCSGYDCEFVALARALGTILVTVDRRILRDFPGVAVALDQYVSTHQ